MILSNLKDYHIILGSKSPRRQRLLKEIGIDFEVKVIEEFNESYPNNLIKEEIPIYLAEQKALAFENIMNKNTLLITADTIVWMNNDVLGKPRDETEAELILRKLSDTMHHVYSGVCVKTIFKKITFYAKTEVYFSKLSDEEIKFYIDKYKPFDKAGAYGIQEFIGYIGVERIEGSFFNVMGLPIHRLYQELKKF